MYLLLECMRLMFGFSTFNFKSNNFIRKMVLDCAVSFSNAKITLQIFLYSILINCKCSSIVLYIFFKICLWCVSVCIVCIFCSLFTPDVRNFSLVDVTRTDLIVCLKGFIKGLLFWYYTLWKKMKVVFRGIVKDHLKIWLAFSCVCPVFN